MIPIPKPLKRGLLALVLLAAPAGVALGQFQQGQLQYSQQFRLSDGVIRIAEPGQLADTVNVWGDINNPGRFLIPRGTSVHEMISYARGPNRFTTGDTQLDWSEVRIVVVVSRKDSIEGKEQLHRFEYRYNQSLDPNMRAFVLRNDDMVALQIRRKATFRDYIQVISPTVSLVLSAILLYDRVNGD